MSTFKRHRWLLLILLLGLIARLAVMRFPPFPIDMNDWIAWGERVLAVGPANFYSDKVFADYAPGYVYVMWLTAAFKNGLLPSAGIGTYYFLYRSVPVAVDLLTGVLLFRVVAWAQGRKAEYGDAQAARGDALPLLAAAAHVFNPAIIFNSAVWGQIDSIFTLGMLLSVVLMLRGRAEWAAASYVIAFMIKPQAISVAPVLGLLLLLRYPPRRWLTTAAIGVGLAYLLAVPFLGPNALYRLVLLLRKSVDTYPYTSLFTYNLWGLYGFWQDDRVASPLGISLRSLGTLLYLLGIVYGAWLCVRQLRRGAHDPLTVSLFALYFAFLPVMVLTRMHERYLYPVLPFMLFWAMLGTTRRAAAMPEVSPWRHLLNVPVLGYLLLAVLHTLNLYQVYIYYLFYDEGVPRSNWLFYFVDDNGKLWSAITLLVFAAIALVLLRPNGGRTASPALANHGSSLQPSK